MRGALSNLAKIVILKPAGSVRFSLLGGSAALAQVKVDRLQRPNEMHALTLEINAFSIGEKLGKHVRPNIGCPSPCVLAFNFGRTL